MSAAPPTPAVAPQAAASGRDPVRPDADETEPLALEELRRRLEIMTGRRTDGYKSTVLRRRIAVRQRATGARTLTGYLARCERDPAEWTRLADALTVHVTSFRRDPDVWERVRELVVPELRAHAPTALAWSAACSNGAEAYTMAMLLADVFPLPSFTVVATDLDEASVAATAAARYPATMLTGLPRPWHDAWVSPAATPAPHAPDRGAPHAHHRTLDRTLVQRVVAHQHDLLTEPPPVTQADLVVCRNVLIYFDRDGQRTAFECCWSALRPGGFLLLGAVEHVPPTLADRFAPVDARIRLYRRRS